MPEKFFRQEELLQYVVYFFRKRGIKEKKSTQLVLVKSKNTSKKECSGDSANNTSLFASPTNQWNNSKTGAT